MKKTTLTFLLLLLTGFCTFAQTLEQNANWPNANWSLTGSYNSSSLALEANPLVTSTFSYDDNDAGYSYSSTIAAESPVIDLTAAYNAEETWIKVETEYIYNHSYNDYIQLQYWDADSSSWVDWGDPLNTDTYYYAYNNYCSYNKTDFVSDHLNISEFTSTQLTGFKYRIYFTDGGNYTYGFCFNAPTIYSQTPPPCPSVSDLNATNATDTTVDISWTENGSATYWNIDYGPAGFTQGTGTSVVATSNPHTLNNLESNTDYEFYVQSNCILYLG
ncbi:Fibronectin type III domain-containing protein, partial [Pustulibacterium marinum]